jgi:hypothetical protein
LNLFSCWKCALSIFLLLFWVVLYFLWRHYVIYLRYRYACLLWHRFFTSALNRLLNRCCHF